MATRNIVPRATGEGSIGTPEKKWNSINAEEINVYSERTAPVNTLQRETAYAVDDIVYTSKLNAKYYLLCITGGTTGSVEPSFVGAESNTQITDGTVVWRVQTITSQEKAAGVPVGFEYFQMNPNVPEGSLPLLGGVYSRDTYKDLWEWVQLQGGYLKTEAEWQTLSTANNGNVPYYSSGDGSTTFRVPSLKCWIKGANGTVSEVGSYLAAGLPNITGDFRFHGNGTATVCSYAHDVFVGKNLNSNTYRSGGSDQTGAASYGYVDFDASRSSSIYGNSSTVQPPSIVGMWLVKAYGVVEDTGSIDEQAYIDDRMADLKNVYLPANYLPLSGGTMKGDITFDKQLPTIAGNGRTMLTGGTNNINGSSVQFYPYNYTDTNSAGTFVIRASNRSSFEDTDPTHKNIDLVGKPDGTLTWGGVSLTDGSFLTVRHVTIYPSQSGVAVNIGNATAPAVSGYQFVCWFCCVSDGGVYPCYASSPDSSTTGVWGNNVVTGTGVKCYALYVRKW